MSLRCIGKSQKSHHRGIDKNYNLPSKHQVLSQWIHNISFIVFIGFFQELVIWNLQSSPWSLPVCGYNAIYLQFKVTDNSKGFEGLDEEGFIYFTQWNFTNNTSKWQEYITLL